MVALQELDVGYEIQDEKIYQRIYRAATALHPEEAGLIELVHNNSSFLNGMLRFVITQLQ